MSLNQIFYAAADATKAGGEPARTHPSHYATPDLRFVQRLVPNTATGDGEPPSITRTLLQQRWHPNYPDGVSEWRDVPVVAEQSAGG